MRYILATTLVALFSAGLAGCYNPEPPLPPPEKCPSGTTGTPPNCKPIYTPPPTPPPTPQPVLVPLTVNKSGQGAVLSSPSGINCGTSCTASFLQGSNVTLQATPSAGSVFRGWAGAGCGQSLTCTVNMLTSLSVVATFEQIPPDLNACQGSTAPLLVGRPSNFSGSEMLRWYTREGCVSNKLWGSWTDSGSNFVGLFCAITDSSGLPVLSHRTIANEQFVGYPGSGTRYSASDPGNCSFSPEELAKLDAGKYTLSVRKEHLRARSGILGGWVVDTVSVSPALSDSFYLDRQATVTFELSPKEAGSATLFWSNSSKNCTEGLCSITAPAGQVVEIRLNANSGWRVNGWRGEGIDTSGCQGDVCRVRATSSGKVVALFANQVFTLRTISGDGGTLTSRPRGILCGDDCQESFLAGEGIEIVANPQNGYILAGWGGDCQGSGVCRVMMNGDRTVRAEWREIEPPAINGPEVVFEPVVGGKEPRWTVPSGDIGSAECWVDEESLYTSNREDENDDPPAGTRRYQGRPCLQEKQTPSFWEGRILEEDNDKNNLNFSGDEPPVEMIEQRGRILPMQDGTYNLKITQYVPGGIASAVKKFYLDRLPPEPIRIRQPDQADTDLQEISGAYQWTFFWGRDLTQTGDMEGRPGEMAGVRCEIRPVERNDSGFSIGNPVLESDWGGCGSQPGFSQTPLTWPDGKTTADLDENRYRLVFYQRDRAGHVTTTAMPFEKLNLFSADVPGQDRVRFAARWQNVFVAATRPPSGREGTIGEAWHPLRCNAPGTGLLHDCLTDIDGESLEGASAEESEDNFLELGPDELREKSFLIQEGDPLASYRAQGFVRLATPGRFETGRGDRRTLHARLTVDPAFLFQDEEEWEEGDPFCNLAGDVSAFDIAGQVEASQPCTSFPVEEANLFLRPDNKGVVVEEDQVSDEPIEIEPRPEYSIQNAITGNSEIHVCQPGVPRFAPVDVWDGAGGVSRADLGPLPDKGCEGYLLRWIWNENVRDAVCANPPEGSVVCGGGGNLIGSGAGQLRFQGNSAEFCQVGVPREADLPVPTLEEMAEGSGRYAGISKALLDRVGSYRSHGADLPYKSNGKPRWEGGSRRGDPLLLDSAPWSEEGRVVCDGNNRYLSPEYGQWSLWLPGDQEPSLFREDRKSALPALAGPGFGRGLFSLPLANNLDGNAATLDEGMFVDFALRPPASSASGGRNGYYWFLDARYYGYHLQRWAYSTDLESDTRDIEVLMPRSSR